MKKMLSTAYLSEFMCKIVIEPMQSTYPALSGNDTKLLLNKT